jgi:hypothetical protein
MSTPPEKLFLKWFKERAHVLCLPDTLADQFIVPLDEIHAEGGNFPAIRFVHKYIT